MAEPIAYENGSNIDTNATTISIENNGNDDGTTETKRRTTNSGSQGRRKTVAADPPTTEQTESQETVKPVNYTDFSVEEKKPRGRPASTQDATHLTTVFMMLLNGAVIGIIGDYAAFNKAESDLISAGLTRMLQSGSKSTLKKISKFADPISLVMGFGMWAIRINNYRRALAEMEARNEKNPPNFGMQNTPVPNVSTNGHAGDPLMESIAMGITDI